MYMTIVIIFILLEIAFIAGLVKLYFVINHLIERVPRLQNEILEEIVYLKEELKELNDKLEQRPPEALNPREIGQIMGGILSKVFFYRKVPLRYLLFTLIKHRKRIPATFKKYRTC